MSDVLTPEQETQARELAARLKEEAGDSFLAIARLLVTADESTLFGEREFAIRKHTLDLLGQAYNVYLAQKKTATAVRPSSARTAIKRPATTMSGRRTHKASGE
jgi:hypothetical protein